MSNPKETDPKERPMGFEPWLRNPPTREAPKATRLGCLSSLGVVGTIVGIAGLMGLCRTDKKE